MCIWGKLSKFCDPLETTQREPYSSTTGHVFTDLCFSQLERPPATSAASSGSPPVTSLSVLSALHTLHTPVTYTEHRGVTPAFPHLGTKFRVPSPPQRPHPLSHSFLRIQRLAVFSSLASKNTGSDWHLFSWGHPRGGIKLGPVDELGELLRKSMKMFSDQTNQRRSELAVILHSSFWLSPMASGPCRNDPFKPTKCLGFGQGSGSRLPLCVISTLWTHFTTR